MEQSDVRALVGLNLDGVDRRLRIAFSGGGGAFHVIVAGEGAIGTEAEGPFSGQLFAVRDRHADFFPLGEGVVGVGHHQEG